MKTSTSVHKFRMPATVLRFITLQKEWHKAEYRALESHLPQWEKKYTLRNGTVENGKLLLRHDLLQTADQLPTDVLMLESLRHVSWVELFHRSHHLPHFLNLHRKEEEIWIELNDDYYPHMGSKKRDRFDILPLLPGKSVAIHINARYWHSLFGRGMDTHYVENYLYLENLGQFEQAELVENLEVPFLLEPDKDVDLRQMMY